MKLALAYKNFAANRAVCHIGLGVTAMNAARAMRSKGIQAEVWPIVSPADLRAKLQKDSEVTHLVVSAPWIQTPELAQFCADFHEVRFAVNCHSNLGFLQADPSAMRLVREGIELGRSTWNFQIAANCERLARWVEAAYSAPCLRLPNIYHLESTEHTKRQPYTSGTLRIGAFGATRALKNLMTAAGAAVEIANNRRADLEFWISSGRNEGAGPVLDSVRQMVQGLAHVKLVESPWAPWPQFRQTVRHMHLMLQPSYTESFNVVTADGVAEGVASVVSDAIEWAPETWKATVDDAGHIAQIGLKLLANKRAPAQGLKALERHNAKAWSRWRDFLN